MGDKKEIVAVQKRTRQLEPGMILARDVYSNSGCPLINEGKELTQQDIHRLKQRNTRFVYVFLPEQTQAEELKPAS